MKTLNIYVTKNVLITFIVAIGVLTFGLMGVHLIKIFDYISKGIPIIAAFRFLLYVLPLAISLTIPFALLVSVMLIFGRMSADNEITAMRACGISILQIISPLIFMTFILTCICLALQIDIGPRLAGEAKDMIQEVGQDQPLAIIEPGRTIRFDDYYIFVNDKYDKNKIKDVQFFRMDLRNNKVLEDITAARGRIDVDKESKTLRITVYEASIVSYPRDSSQPKRIQMDEFSFVKKYGEMLNRRHLGKKPSKMSLSELFGRAIINEKRKLSTTKLEVELNKRIVLALSPIAFLLLGMPLAIRTSRRETSVGLFLSVILAGVYFIGVTICPSLDSHPEYHPELLIWLPNLIYQGFGAFYLFRIARK